MNDLLDSRRPRPPASLLSHSGGQGRPRSRRNTIATSGLTSAAEAAEGRRQAEIEQELRLARDIQQGLLLEAVPHLPGWEISAVSLPARDLGGDLYDFLPLGDGLEGIMIGDVSGKGLPAALRMAVARTVFRHEARSLHQPPHVLASINRSMLRDIPHGMITMLYAQLDTASGALHIANAGHNYPLLIGTDVSELEASGLPLGVDLDAEYTLLTATLLPGQSVLLYTDGVVEAESAHGEIFGFERLQVLLHEYRSLKPRAVIAAVLHDVRSFVGGLPIGDDVTMVALRRRLRFLGDELRSIADDVLGSDRAAGLWHALPLPSFDAPPDAWAPHLPQIVGETQGRYGRAVAREIQSQLRLAIDDYRQDATP